MYLLRLDDASEFMDIKKWNDMENLLDKYNIKPIVGVIPKNEDETFVKKYERDIKFWDKIRGWQRKEWEIALHGFNHVYTSNSGGMNPVNYRSEFAGISLEQQQVKIAKGISIFNENKLKVKIFFSPSHTFDSNTLEALKRESHIRIINDTIANDLYKEGEFYFIPQQFGHVKWSPFKVTTFCYHPNYISEIDMRKLEKFLKKNGHKFVSFKDLPRINRDLTIYDRTLRRLYFAFRKVRNILRKNLGKLRNKLKMN